MNIYQRYRNDFSANLKLASPIILGQVGQIAVNFIDNIMVGNLENSAASLAAIALANSVFIVVMVVGMGLSFALPPLIAEAEGNQNHKHISQYFKHSLMINIAFALFAMLVIESLIPMMHFWKQDAEVVQLAIPYLRINMISMLPFMLFQSLRCYADGRSETMPAMIAMLIGNVINVIANYGLIYGQFGLPKYGVSGAAFGTLISRIVMFFLLFFILRNWKTLWVDIQNASYKTYKQSIFSRLLKLGIPTSLQGFFEVTAFATASILAGQISKEVQAAHQVSINMASLTFMVCTGFAMASTIRVSNFFGEKNQSKIRSSGFSTIIQVVVFMTCTSILFICLRNILPQIYTKVPEVIEIASGLLILAAIFQIPDGIQVTAIGALRGLQDVFIPSLITFVAYWVLALPIAYYLAFYKGLGANGIWIGLTIGLSCSAIFMTYRFHKQSKKI